MKLLLDTHILLWTLGDPQRLSSNVAALLEDPANQLALSVVSVWETNIKYASGNLHLPQSPEIFWPTYLAEMKIDLLPVKLVHAIAVHSLPRHHRDPFDRMIIAQAMIEKLPIITVDAAFKAYPIQIIS